MVTLQADGSIEFRFYRPDVWEMFLVGDFNGWHQASHPMTRDVSGHWSCRIHLPEGVYKFRYRSSGHWYVDYAAFGVECGPYGHDSVLSIERSQVTSLTIACTRAGIDSATAASGTQEGDMGWYSGESAISSSR